jgi:hypothetical protein
MPSRYSAKGPETPFNCRWYKAFQAKQSMPRLKKRYQSRKFAGVAGLILRRPLRRGNMYLARIENLL